MPDIVRVLVIGLGAYLLGSVSFALLITRWRAGIDVRSVGSRHATATNTMRAAGWLAGGAVMILDLCKGYLAVWIARRLAVYDWEPALSAAMVIIGHCWPVFADFRGGMGAASGGGALLATWPLGMVLGVGLGAACQLIIRHSARANVATGLLIGPLWWLFGASRDALLLVIVCGAIVAYRALSDWKRVYRELWWDRE